MATFQIYNFGCRASQADGAGLKRQLLQAGLQEVASPEESSVAVLNTCTVTASADAEVRQFVRRIHRRNPQCRILVTGCYAQRAPEEIARLEGVAWVVGNSHKHLVSSLLAAADPADSAVQAMPASPEPAQGIIPGAASGQPAATPLVQLQTNNAGNTRQADGGTLSGAGFHSSGQLAVPSPGSFEAGFRTRDALVLVGGITEEFHFAPVFADDRTRPTLKIQDGCDARCSFCVIPSVRGPSRSLPPGQVVDQIRQLVDGGFHEVVLSGINLGGYGRDLGREVNFLAMVKRILTETTVARIRISSIEPMDVNSALIELVSSEHRMARHFHVPLQSGSDRILRLMNRRYWTRQYAERILAIRERIPNAAIGADVMVGFPGETAQDHAASLRFIESLPFTYLHLFPFSARPGTPASSAAAQVNGRVARDRSQEIRAVLVAKRQRFLAAQVGQTLPALTLNETEDGARIALTTNYLNVTLPAVDVAPNRLVDVRVARAVSGKLFGYVTSS